MKRTSTLLLFLLLAAAPVMFTGCGPSEDEILAMLVDGRWDGVMDISYTKNGVKYPSTGTHIQFWNDISTTAGHGKWCNTFADDAPINYLSYDFSWAVEGDVIYIQFKADNSENMERAKMKIGSYLITEYKFTGKISSMDGSKDASFNLIHTYSPWAWDYYPVIYPWDVYPFYPWYDPWYDPYYW